LETKCLNPASAELKSRLLLERVLGLIRRETDTGRQLATQLQKLADPSQLADFVAGNLIRDAITRYPLLGMAEVEERLDYLLELLPHPGSKPAKP
jgi:hypothetical protein